MKKIDVSKGCLNLCLVNVSPNHQGTTDDATLGTLLEVEFGNVVRTAGNYMRNLYSSNQLGTWQGIIMKQNVLIYGFS